MYSENSEFTNASNQNSPQSPGQKRNKPSNQTHSVSYYYPDQLSAETTSGTSYPTINSVSSSFSPFTDFPHDELIPPKASLSNDKTLNSVPYSDFAQSSKSISNGAPGRFGNNNMSQQPPVKESYANRFRNIIQKSSIMLYSSPASSNTGRPSLSRTQSSPYVSSSLRTPTFP